MNSKPTKDHVDLYISHTISTLPDSLRARKTVLVVLLSLLPRDSRHRQAIRTMLEALHIHEANQLKLAGLAGNHKQN